ncbi:MAG: hypothetical protein ACI4TM_04360 [Candidatus Cryptobacteroides sp.]
MKRIITYLAMVFVAVCCTNMAEEKIGTKAVHDGEKACREVRFCTEIFGETEVDVKSIIGESGKERLITGITLAAYNHEGMLYQSKHFTNYRQMSLQLESSHGYVVYALANMGDMSGEFPFREAELPNIIYKVEDFDGVAETGIPMCGISEQFDPKTTPVCDIGLRRMFAKLSVRILHDGLRTNQHGNAFAFTMCNKSIHVRQANSVLRPFAQSGSRATGPADLLSESDRYENLNQIISNPEKYGPGPGYMLDTTLTLYVPENVQGKLLKGNTDSFYKTAENISSIGGKDYSGICTYLEFNAKRESSESGYGGSVTYRYYLGADSTTDFSIERNCRYDITLNFSDEAFFKDNGWKITKLDDWQDNRALNFLQTEYSVIQGCSTDVFVRYQLKANPDNSSTKKPDDWKWYFDESSFGNCGLTYYADMSALHTSPDGKNHFKFTFTAADNAIVGSALPLRISTWDGSITDEALITIEENTPLSPEWSFKPSYVAQTGTVSIGGGVSLPLELTAVEGDNIIVSQTGESEFKVTATGVGTGAFTVSDGEGKNRLRLTLNIKAPVLKLSSGTVSLNPDGTAVQNSYSYLDSNGVPLTNLNSAAFNNYLLPVVAGSGFVTATANQSRMNLYISSFNDSGTSLKAGDTYSLSVCAKDCPLVDAKQLTVKVSDPFAGITKKDLGRIDDYSLFMNSSTNVALRSIFSSAISSTATYKYDAPAVNADFSCMSAVLSACWTGNFSYENGTYNISYAKDSSAPEGYKLTVTRKSVSSITTHSAGRHDVLLRLTNKHSGEHLDKLYGTVGVYVHTAVGAEATFGILSCDYAASGCKSVSAMYNTIAGNAIFSTGSGKSIYYADVTVNYMTDISQVLVFSKMKSATDARRNILDCLDIARPSVADGTKKNGRLLISILDNDTDDRLTSCGEPYAYRRGIGKMLYRALLYPATDISLSTSELTTIMLGMETAGKGIAAYAPFYNIHNMNVGNNMTQNIVKKDSPYVFSPASMQDCTDDNGGGYHIIHFLDHLVPDTCGWINILRAQQ